MLQWKFKGRFWHGGGNGKWRIENLKKRHCLTVPPINSKFYFNRITDSSEILSSLPDDFLIICVSFVASRTLALCSLPISCRNWTQLTNFSETPILFWFLSSKFVFASLPVARSRFAPYQFLAEIGLSVISSPSRPGLRLRLFRRSWPGLLRSGHIPFQIRLWPGSWSAARWHI